TGHDHLEAILRKPEIRVHRIQNLGRVADGHQDFGHRGPLRQEGVQVRVNEGWGSPALDPYHLIRIGAIPLCFASKKIHHGDTESTEARSEIRLYRHGHPTSASRTAVCKKKNDVNGRHTTIRGSKLSIPGLRGKSADMSTRASSGR